MPDPDDLRRLDRLDHAIFGVSTEEGGLLGEIRELKAEVRELGEKHSSLYKLLAVTALSVLGSGLGVVVTLLSTSH